MQVTDKQIIQALAENGHDDEAKALSAKVDPSTDQPPRDMNATLRKAAGRE